jgi:energy-coupling factor transporter ATP-binding protein EcfA2
MADGGISAAVAAIELVELAHKQGWFGKLLTALKTKHRVLVLGSTGSGKTLFLDSLSESIPKAIDLLSRTEFIEDRSLQIEKRPFIFIDTPGQVGHESLRKREILKAMKTGVAGVINVVSYGYHESRVYDASETLSKGKADGSFLQRQRDEEIRQLSEWTELLGGHETTGWLITVVTKADLWWDRRKEVMSHYEVGPYFQALGSAQRLTPVVLEYCSVFQKFYEKSPMSGNFQDGDRVRARAHLLRGVLAAVARGSNA